MTEIWKDIENYEGRYQISSTGRIKALSKTVYWQRDGKDCKRYHRSEYVMKNVVTSKGYEQITLSSNSTQVRMMVHQLVAKHFLASDALRPHVNHKDGNKRNNKAENLEWCTQAENNRHKYHVLGCPGSNKGKYGNKSSRYRTVKQLSIKGDLVKVWGSASDAVREAGFDSSCISRVAHGQSNSHKGYRWEYV